MVGSLIRWCLNNRALTLVFFLFLILAGIYALQHTPVDAIPDIGENQQIIFTNWPGRSPKDIEDQITYPLSSAL